MLVNWCLCFTIVIVVQQQPSGLLLSWVAVWGAQPAIDHRWCFFACFHQTFTHAPRTLSSLKAFVSLTQVQIVHWWPTLALRHRYHLPEPFLNLLLIGRHLPLISLTPIITLYSFGRIFLVGRPSSTTFHSSVEPWHHRTSCLSLLFSPCNIAFLERLYPTASKYDRRNHGMPSHWSFQTLWASRRIYSAPRPIDWPWRILPLENAACSTVRSPLSACRECWPSLSRTYPVASSWPWGQSACSLR